MTALALCSFAALVIGWRQCARGLGDSGLGTFMSGIVLLLCALVGLFVACLKAFA